jgi:hypothetical protein
VVVYSSVKNMYWKLRERLTTKSFVDFGGGRCAIVLGYMRSGTTWLANCVNHVNAYRYIFEPLTGIQMPYANGNRFNDVYVAPGADDAQLREHLDRVFSGTWRDVKSDAHNTRVFARHRLIKFVRINIALRWLCETYPQWPKLMVIRNPYSAALSMCSHPNMNWYANNLRNWQADKELWHRYLDDKADLLLADDLTLPEQHLIKWCVHHMVPFRECDPSQFHYVFYEHLLRDLPEQLAALCAGLQMPYDHQRAMRLCSTWSFTSTRRKPLINATEVRDVVGGEVHDRMKHILRRFDLTYVYGDEPFPITDNPFSFKG